ncbi:MAG: aldo/keto reductase [Lachnospiraceae bacterium]|nr:aldo/keto reductase [Lachnospiraceae bacterium]
METSSTRKTSKLGFGLMRLPRKGLFIDVEQTKQMVDLFLEAGCTYFDTAFVYPGSEEAARKALVERHPRESYTLATKLMASAALNEKKAKEEFLTSLGRLGTDYIDYYLLHCLQDDNYRKYERFGLWDYVKDLKDRGVIREYGFSFHSGPELLDELLTAHPDVSFVQLQINYADWENKRIRSRANYEVARKHGKPIVIMEPVKGGSLAKPPKEVQRLFKEADPDASFASWAIRFAASLPGIRVVLSGMSDIAQMQDNLSYMRDFRPLSEKEQAVIHEAQRIMGRSKTIPCTACRYCTPGCPMQIPIPDIFSAMNLYLGSGQKEEAGAAYRRTVGDGAGASACIGCGQCADACPQHLEIPRLLGECAEALEG